jgi:hypothetical protein
LLNFISKKLAKNLAKVTGVFVSCVLNRKYLFKRIGWPLKGPLGLIRLFFSSLGTGKTDIFPVWIGWPLNSPHKNSKPVFRGTGDRQILNATLSPYKEDR